MKLSQKIQLQANQKIKQRLYILDNKYKLLEEKGKKDLEKKKLRDIRKAEILVERRADNAERRLQGKVLKPKRIDRVKKCDDVFSKYILKIYGNQCYTCNGDEKPGCGHFITRMCRELRRDIRNARPQGFFCCNAKFSGNGRPTEMKARLKSEGVNTDELEEIYLESKRNPKGKPSEDKLKEIYGFYSSKL